jgi:hypothetical protein
MPLRLPPLGVLAITVLLAACNSRGPAASAPPRLLSNPVLDARAALARGDSTFLAIDRAPVTLPGLEGTGISADSLSQYRLFSRRSLGLDTQSWIAQRDSLTTYAAAYNRLIFEAR